jgi:hypothetical protein
VIQSARLLDGVSVAARARQNKARAPKKENAAPPMAEGARRMRTHHFVIWRI